MKAVGGGKKKKIKLKDMNHKNLKKSIYITTKSCQQIRLCMHDLFKVRHHSLVHRLTVSGGLITEVQ